MRIDMGVQTESTAGGLISRMHPRWNELFDKHMGHDYCPGVDWIALVLRLATSRREFGLDGPQRRRFMKKQRYITIDLVLNEDSYKEQSDEENRELLLGLIEQGLTQCVEKLQAEKCDVDARRLFEDFGKFKQEFRRRWKSK